MKKITKLKLRFDFHSFSISLPWTGSDSPFSFSPWLQYSLYPFLQWKLIPRSVINSWSYSTAGVAEVWAAAAAKKTFHYINSTSMGSWSSFNTSRDPKDVASWAVAFLRTRTDCLIQLRVTGTATGVDDTSATICPSSIRGTPIVATTEWLWILLALSWGKDMC